LGSRGDAFIAALPANLPVLFIDIFPLFAATLEKESVLACEKHTHDTPGLHILRTADCMIITKAGMPKALLLGLLPCVVTSGSEQAKGKGNFRDEVTEKSVKTAGRESAL
jgi:hypothetical protein